MIDHSTAATIAATHMDVALRKDTLAALGQVRDTPDSRIGYAVATEQVTSRWDADSHVSAYINLALRAAALGRDELALSCLRLACGAIQYLTVGSDSGDIE